MVMLVILSMILAVNTPTFAAPMSAKIGLLPAAVTQAAPDIAGLYGGLMNSLPPDKGYASVKAVDVSKQLAEAKPPFLLDVREPAELEKDGFIKGAVNISVRSVLKNLDKLPAPDSYILIYCGSGQRGGMLMGVLRLLGYNNTFSMGGGLIAWKAANLPVVTGSKPDEAKAISKPAIKDQALFTALDGYMSTLPDGFLALKADKVADQLKAAKPPVLIDLRTPEERENSGYIKDSVNIPFNKLFTSLDKLPAKDAPFIIYCGSGHRGAVAIVGLQMLGYTKTLNLGGGLNGWKAANLPVEGVVDWAAVWPDFLKGLPADSYTVKSDMLFGQIKAGNPPFLVDVREAKEIESAGFIKGAVNIPIRNLLKNLDKLPALDKPIVVYCGSGHRGGLAISALRLLGYSNVNNLGGGFGAWTKANLAVEKSKPAEPKAGTAAKVDELRLKALDKFLSSLPDGFYSMGAADVKKALAATPAPVVIDVRTADEIKSGYIKGSVFILINDLLSDMKKLPSDKAAPIITVCQSGHRGAIAMMALRLLGYTNVNSLFKGINGWTAENLPLEK